MRRRGSRLRTVVNTTPNTFIGGVASTISTKAALATKLAIAEISISYFGIVGSDIEAGILSNYDIPDFAFNGDLSITHYEDPTGMVNLIKRGAFRSSKITKAIFPNAQFKEEVFREASLLNEINCDSATYFDSVTFFRCNALVQISAPNLISAFNAISGSTSSGCFREMGGITLIDMPKCTQIGRTNGDDGVFLLIKTGCVINVDSSLATSNSGAMDGDLEYAINSRGATVNFIVN